jgi:hypothetical protein
MMTPDHSFQTVILIPRPWERDPAFEARDTVRPERGQSPNATRILFGISAYAASARAI